jgi:hypothetical protein
MDRVAVHIEIKDLRPATDLLMFRIMRDERFCLLRHAAQYIWRHQNSAYRRVRQLEKAEFVQTYRDHYARETIIRPRKKAYDALLVRGLLSKEEYAQRWHWRHLHERTVGFILHEAAVTEVRFALINACRTCSGVKLLSCRSGPPIWREVLVDSQRRSLRPDREVILSVPGSDYSQTFFFEIDRGSRTIIGARWTIARQMELYDEYASLTEEPFRVIVLCPTRERIASLIEKLGQGRMLAPGRAYGLWDDFVANPLRDVLTRECDGAACSLIEPWRGWPTY